MAPVRSVRCGFALVKLSLGGTECLLMRRDPQWGDLTFIGGHENPGDRANLQTTARRECLEEVPALRGARVFDLSPLGEEARYGPTRSRSSPGLVEYTVRFFALRFRRLPEAIAAGFGPRSLNVWVPQDEVLAARPRKISAFAQVLETAAPGGVRSIPLSWSADLPGAPRLPDGPRETA